MTSSNHEETRFFMDELAEWILAQRPELLPDNVRSAASRLTLDSVACALGGKDHDASEVVLEVVRAMGGTPECTLIGEELRVPPASAALYNSLLVRALDCNDIYFHNGPLGHPSDNIPVALAIAEQQHSSGLEFLNAVSVGYELNWRISIYLRSHVPPNGAHWDYVSTSGIVGAAMAGLLLKLDAVKLANALAIAGVQGFILPALRRGEVSMLKASATSFGANLAVISVLMAAAGMTGPRKFFEGDGGLITSLAIEGGENYREELAGDIDHWHILEASSKPYPAIGTSQSAIAATLSLIKEYGVKAADVEEVLVRLPDVYSTRQQISDPGFLSPKTREAADHSLRFLVSVSLEDGQFGVDQFHNERWLNKETQSLMERVKQSADATLNSHTSHGYPAVVTIRTKDGRQLVCEMLDVPGSPDNPLSDGALKEKLRTFASTQLSESKLSELAARCLALQDEADMSALVQLLGK